LFEYLEPGYVKNLLNVLTGYFAKGQIIFDVMNTFGVNSGKKKLKAATGAVLKWAVDDLKEVDKMNAKLKRQEAVALLKSKYMQHLPSGTRFVLRILSVFSSYKNMIRVLRYGF
jgi:hypothetical protein